MLLDRPRKWRRSEFEMLGERGVVGEASETGEEVFQSPPIVTLVRCVSRSGVMVGAKRSLSSFPRAPYRYLSNIQV